MWSINLLIKGKFKIVKYKGLEIEFSISSEYFKESSGYYYVVLRVLDKNFRVLNSEIVDGNYKILEENWKFFKKIFNKKNLSRKECILLPFKTLAKALKS